MAGSDIKTKAVVLRRTNYGEADRIINILTPEGKMAVMAKGVRKEKSKLAGGIEMFSLTQINLHQGKGKFAVLTGAKTEEFYQNLLSDFERMEVAAGLLKKISKVSEMIDNPEFFSIIVQALRALNKGGNAALVQAWFYFNLAVLSGEQVNLYKDTNGKDLKQGKRYTWDGTEKALRPDTAGKISTDEIKMMRLFLNAELSLVMRVKQAEEMAGELFYVAKTLNQM
ncbi:DNA repair protein RecO [Candidatus Saccharibacteria bacterium]|nr:DNA repair protein RecO [Candidatus Saccharibacteria bacterium]